jgi:integrase
LLNQSYTNRPFGVRRQATRGEAVGLRVRDAPRPKSSAAWFAAAVQRATIQQVTPHDLRHTCASLAVSAGVDVLALQRMRGHTSAKVTLDIYADLFDDDLDAVAITRDSRYSRESVAKMWPRGPHGGSQQTSK